MKKRVSYIFPISHHFRYPFHVRLRSLLAAKEIDYRVVYSAPFGVNLHKRDVVEIPWGHKTPLLRFGGHLLQWAPGDVMKSDLVIIQQENRLLINYAAQGLSIAGLRKVAFFGHGRNFQAPDPNSRAEKWKKFWATKVDWWFAYTDETKNYITSLGYPTDRVTVFNNAIDTSEIRSLAEALREDDLSQLRNKLGLSGRHVGIYVGGLYAEKRIDFLLASLDLIRTSVKDFEFIFVGGGPEQSRLEQAAAARPWLKVVGPKFGSEKVQLMALAHLFLIPGLVGLAILDAGVMGLPVITTDYPFHSPEIAYLSEGANGLIVRPWTDVASYSEAVVSLLTTRTEKRMEMSLAAKQIASNYTVEAMAMRFAGGVVAALGT